MKRTAHTYFSVRIVRLMWLLLLMVAFTSVHAQVVKPFTKRATSGTPTNGIYRIRGDFSMAGNTNLTRTGYLDGNATDPNGGNSNTNMSHVDVDNDPITWNSSMSELKLPLSANSNPACTNILFAGLYWTGRSNISNQYTFNVTKNAPQLNNYDNTQKVDHNVAITYTPYTMSVTRLTEIVATPVNQSFNMRHSSGGGYVNRINNRGFDYTLSVTRLGSSNPYYVQYLFTGAGNQPNIVFEFTNSDDVSNSPRAIRYSTDGGSSWTEPTGQSRGTLSGNKEYVTFDPVTINTIGGVSLTIDRLERNEGQNRTQNEYRSDSYARITVSGIEDVNVGYYPRYTFTAPSLPTHIFEVRNTAPYVYHSTDGGGTFVSVAGQNTPTGTTTKTYGFTPITLWTDGTTTLNLFNLVRDSRVDRTVTQTESASDANVRVFGQVWQNSSQSRTFDKRKIKFKKEGQPYVEYTANGTDIHYATSSYGGIFSAYHDVTPYVQTHGVGNYWAADIALLEGDGGDTGYFGCWSLVVVYENAGEIWRDVMVYDGHAFVQREGSSGTTTSYDLAISGFQAAQNGLVKVKMGIMAGEGDRDISGDFLSVRERATSSYPRVSHGGNTTGNFFNSSVFTGGNNRLPSYTNNTGIDIAMFYLQDQNTSPQNQFIDNNQTATTLRYGSTQDLYTISMVALAIDAYVPDVNGVSSAIATSGGGPLTSGTSTVTPGQEIEYTVQVSNNAEAIQNAMLNIPIPYTASYVPGSASIVYNNVTGGQQAVHSGIPGTLTVNMGTLAQGTAGGGIANLRATLKFKIKVTDDCQILKTPAGCSPVLTLGGMMSGMGVTSQTPFSNVPLINGFSQDGPCVGSPISGPLNFNIDAAAFIAANCQDVDPQRAFYFCNTTAVPFDDIASQFPIGTEFYNIPRDGTGTLIEYDESNPFPTTAGTVTYYAYPPGVSSNCFFTFTITNTSNTAKPITQPATFCKDAVLGSNPLAPFIVAGTATPAHALYYFTTETGGTAQPLTDLIINTSTVGTTTYWIAQGPAVTCSGPRVPIVVTISALPEITANVSNLTVCEGSTGSVSVTATGTNLTYTWEYYNGTTWVSLPNATQDKISINGSTLTLTGASLAYNGSKVRVTVSNGNCSVISGEATITVTSVAAPTTTQSTQTFCEIAPHTVAQLDATALADGTIKWYDAATGGNLLSPTTTLVDGQKYYASQTVGGCESVQRLEVTVAITVIAAPTTAQSTQTFCEIAPHTVANLQATGAGTIKWYDAATGGNLLSPTTTLVDGQKYYASQT
ncbi:Ig-like domain-containing protein, partial [Sphingobacterium yanglingense]